MTKGFVRPARWEDVPILASDLREADVAEIKASSGDTPGRSLRYGVGVGAKVACLPSGIPAAIFGVVPSHHEGLGYIWMVATNQFHLLHRQFLREGGRELNDLCRDYRVVTNFTDARNHVHHRWLRWMGFTIIKRHEQHGAEKLPFLEFVRITEGHHV